MNNIILRKLEVDISDYLDKKHAGSQDQLNDISEKCLSEDLAVLFIKKNVN